MSRTITTSVGTVLVAAAILATGVAFAQERQGAPGGAGGPAAGGGRGPATPPLIMTSTAWEDGGVIPNKYTQAAGATSPNPALSWTQVPPGTQSFVLIMNDPEPAIPAKSSKGDVTHWLVWNIPASSTGLPEGVMPGDLPDGTKQQSLRSNGYMGPGAGPGPYHHYTFTLYAVDTKIDVAASQNAADTRTALINAMDGHVLGKAILVARFHR